MTDKTLPEWYTIIHKTLREQECFSQDMFEENGGYQAYNELEYLLTRENKLELEIEKLKTDKKNLKQICREFFMFLEKHGNQKLRSHTTIINELRQAAGACMIWIDEWKDFNQE